MHSFFCICAFLLGILAISASGEQFNPLLHLGASTSYHEAHDPPLDASLPEGCEVTRATYLLRHGSTVSDSFEYATFVAPFLEKLADGGVNWKASRTFKFLATWTSPINVSAISDLTNEGKEEAFHLGEVIAKRYSNIDIPEKVWTADSERTDESAEQFVKGMTTARRCSESINIIKVSEGEEEGANSLTPFESCSAYSSLLGIPQTLAFEKTYTKPIVARFASDVPSFNFTANDVYAMQLLCGYESRLRGHSPFCDSSVFTSDDWLGFEYTSDILYHFTIGYGTKLSGVMGFPWLNASAELLLSDKATEDLYISFSHREMIGSILVASGLFNNSRWSGANAVNDTMPLTTINFGRLWKSSNFDPYAANIGFEKVMCKAEEDSEFYRVLVNSSPQPLDCADSQGYSCSRSAFVNWVQERQDLFAGFSANCDVTYSNATDILSIFG